VAQGKLGIGEIEVAKRVGGRLCLDFVNTVSGRVSNLGSRRGKDYVDRVIGERLLSYEALLRWGSLTGALRERDERALTQEAAARPARAAAVLKRAVAFREALYRVLKATVEGWTPEPDDLAAVNAELQCGLSRERLVASPKFAWEWEVVPLALDRVLWPVARSAGDLLTSRDLERVGQCPGEGCGWLFLDTSRSGRRRWCDMGDCGNRAKVRRFRERLRKSS
jgi:predicted RNA-binding Zn ribbon-like protein